MGPWNRPSPYEFRSATPPRAAPLRSIVLWLAVAAAIAIVLVIWSALD
jgi:hypothetical protein